MDNQNDDTFLAFANSNSLVRREDEVFLQTNPAHGSLAVGKPLEIVARNNSRMVVRCTRVIQRGTSLETASAGENVAIAVEGLNPDRPLGDVMLTSPGLVTQTEAFDGLLTIVANPLEPMSLTDGVTATMTIGSWEMPVTIVLKEGSPLPLNDDGQLIAERESPPGEPWKVRLVEPYRYEVSVTLDTPTPIPPFGLALAIRPQGIGYVNPKRDS